MKTFIQQTCKECDIEFRDLEALFRHLRKHKITSQEYVLKWDCGGNVPLCACGCGKNTSWNVGLRNYTKFIHGHHATGRIKSEEEKKKIGEKNSKNMRNFLKRNREFALSKVKLMNASNQTDESRRKRRDSVNKTYTLMSPEEKQKFSDHTKEMWQDGTLTEAHVKAAVTFKQRFADGVYDFTERNDKISEAITQRYLDGGFEWSVGQYTSSKTGKTCNYRSSWELEFVELLDAEERVSVWSYEPMSLSYVHEGKTKRYVPDFLVVFEGRDLLVEVKPESLTDTDVNLAKREAAVQFCQRNGWKYVSWRPGIDFDSFLSNS